MDEIELKKRMRLAGLTVREGSTEKRVEACMKAVEWCVQPRSGADRTCLRNVKKWITRSIDMGTWTSDELLPIVIDLAIEASCPESRNPRALFMHLCKTELKYAA